MVLGLPVMPSPCRAEWPREVVSAAVVAEIGSGLFPSALANIEKSLLSVAMGIKNTSTRVWVINRSSMYVVFFYKQPSSAMGGNC